MTSLEFPWILSESWILSNSNGLKIWSESFVFLQNLSDCLELFSIYFGFSCTLLDSIGFFQKSSGFFIILRSLSDSVGCSQIFSELDQILSFIFVFFRILSVFFRILSESLELFSDSLGFFGISRILLDSSDFFPLNSFAFLSDSLKVTRILSNSFGLFFVLSCFSVYFRIIS